MQEYVIDICSYLHVYLILITVVSNMHHDINKKYFSTFLKRSVNCKFWNYQRDYWPIVDAQKFYAKTHSFSTNKTLAEYNSESKCHLKMKFCTDPYFHEILSLKNKLEPR